MFETHKIDSFFSGENNPLDAQETMFMSRRTKVVRFFRLFLPCLTALLLGSGIILFDFETNSDAPVSIADDDKIYFEKFRMKNTVFEVTEKEWLLNNKVIATKNAESWGTLPYHIFSSSSEPNLRSSMRL